MQRLNNFEVETYEHDNKKFFAILDRDGAKIKGAYYPTTTPWGKIENDAAKALEEIKVNLVENHQNRVHESAIPLGELRTGREWVVRSADSVLNILDNNPGMKFILTWGGFYGHNVTEYLGILENGELKNE